MDQPSERRHGDRRSGLDRRQGERAGPGRRRGDRRHHASLAAASAMAVAVAFGSVPDADAQIYTRKNEHGVIEATNVPAERGYQLTYPGKGTLIHSAAWRLRPNYNGEYDHHIAAAAATHGVSTALVRAVIQVESDFDSLARSSKGAQGLMQLMPDTARQLGVSNAFDPRQNIFAGVRYLRILLDMFQGDVALATAAYNGGASNVQRYNGIPPFKETRNYVAKIQSLLSGLGAPMVTAASAQMTSYAPGDNPFGVKAVAAVSTTGTVKRTGKL
ncbi:MAG TPA: lytic transglycosylase domain-containing protein, partial [Vicinamibacteria bacterium]|nr:lytic transglycosylase domain-containing protein [Vicinamibacteria bacterium]